MRPAGAIRACNRLSFCRFAGRLTGPIRQDILKVKCNSVSTAAGPRTQAQLLPATGTVRRLADLREGEVGQSSMHIDLPPISPRA